MSHVLPAGTERPAHSQRHTPRESPSQSNRSRSSPSVSRVNIHIESPEESRNAAATTVAMTERKEQSLREGGYVTDETTAASSIGLTMDTDLHRSKRSTALLAELDARMTPDSTLNDLKLSKQAREFYTRQNELLNGFKEIVGLEESDSSAMEREENLAKTQAQQSRAVKFVIEGSLALTILLIAIKFSAAIDSHSIAVIASAVDSALDLLSQGTLMVTARFMNKKNALEYPIGKSRVESLAVMVFGIIMGLAAVFLFYQSALVIIDGIQTQPAIKVDVVVLTLLGFTIGIQIIAYILCRSVANKGGKNVTAVEAIAADHFNDVCCNTVACVAAVVAAYNHAAWFVDGMGGLIISVYIFLRWVSVVHEQFMDLLGKSADSIFLSKLTYLAANHDSRILVVDTVLAYKLGTKYHCEVHIGLAGDMPLRVAHDIGESLEMNIEKMEDVELAFVHLDFEWQHVGEHDRWSL